MTNKIVEKAYVVWHEGMIGFDEDHYHNVDQIPTTYADNRNQAKMCSREPYEYNLYYLEPTYLDLKVLRRKYDDIILYNNKKYKRSHLNMILNKEKRIKERENKVKSFPDNTKFFIQNGYVGNSMLWWAKNSSGYTTDIEKAELYTKKEVLEKFVKGREEDIIWEEKHILNNIRKHIDGQYVSSKYSA